MKQVKNKCFFSSEGSLSIMSGQRIIAIKEGGPIFINKVKTNHFLENLLKHSIRITFNFSTIQWMFPFLRCPYQGLNPILLMLAMFLNNEVFSWSGRIETCHGPITPCSGEPEHTISSLSLVWHWLSPSQGPAGRDSQVYGTYSSDNVRRSSTFVFHVQTQCIYLPPDQIMYNRDSHTANTAGHKNNNQISD